VHAFRLDRPAGLLPLLAAHQRGGAAQPFADHVVFIGDSGVTRLYKDGIARGVSHRQVCRGDGGLPGDFRRSVPETLSPGMSLDLDRQRHRENDLLHSPGYSRAFLMTGAGFCAWCPASSAAPTSRSA